MTFDAEDLTHLVGAGGQVEHVAAAALAAVQDAAEAAERRRGRPQGEALALHPQPELGRLASGRLEG